MVHSRTTSYLLQDGYRWMYAMYVKLPRAICMSLRLEVQKFSTRRQMPNESQAQGLHFASPRLTLPTLNRQLPAFIVIVTVFQNIVRNSLTSEVHMADL